MKNFTTLVLFCIILSCSPERPVEEPYLGQKPPGNKAELFAPGIVNDGISTRDITFTPDGNEIYFCKTLGDSRFASIFYCKNTKSGWTTPEVVWFAKNKHYIYIEPFISPDGQKMFFVSNEGCEFSEENPFVTDIWVTNRLGNSWSEPNKLDTTINSDHAEFFPSVSENGNLYFTRENAHTREGFIYKSRFKNGIYQHAEKLPSEINAGVARFNAVIAKDESFMIVPAFGMKNTFGASDYYISFFAKEKGWSKLQNMGKTVNSASRLEYSANFSPDGKFLFFMSSKINSNNISEYSFSAFKKFHQSPENGNSGIYWVKSDFINDLKEKATFE